MYTERARQLRQCQAITLNGYGSRCKQFSVLGSNLCPIHLAADNRQFPDEATKVFNKIASRRNRIGKKKSNHNRCSCDAYPFPHHAGVNLCQWPLQPKQRLECKSDPEAKTLRQKLRRKGIVVNTIKEKMESGIGADSRIVDIEDYDPDDLSMEVSYLSQIKYEVDILSLPIDERRKIQKQRIIAECLLKTDKVTLVDGETGLPCVLTDERLNIVSTDGDSDVVEIEGEVYKIG